MRKQEFLIKLKKNLSALPKPEIEECVSFYAEMIEDRIESGLSEEEAVGTFGDPKKIASEKLTVQISEELVANGKGRTKSTKSPGKKNALAITLLAIGSPVWFSLFVASASVIFSLYVSAWAIVLALWAVFSALAVSAPSGILFGLVVTFMGYTVPGVVTVGAALVAAGLAVFCFFACVAITKYCVILTKKTAEYMKKAFLRKENKR